ncbi:hypothetical protein BRC67_02380 [Halobacteriales archaeon QH_3_68_24]|nr:MAG: hypothetical protein BRC67_02380 [Halobacteriales archaeon QH_3_68_24]
MGLYEREYGAEWTTLDKDEATERAYALGVAESLGEYNRDEFEAVHAEVDNACDRSIVALAFREGRTEAREHDPADEDDDRAVWRDLVESETVIVDEDDLPTSGRDGIPEAVDRTDALDKPDPDEVEATDQPDFLDR